MGGLFNYWFVIILMMLGFYIVMVSPNLVKKIMGLNIFQTSVFLLYISIGKISGGTAPILTDTAAPYSNPLPHVLILTAIVVGVATTALGLALVVRIHSAFGSINEDELLDADDTHIEFEDPLDPALEHSAGQGTTSEGRDEQ